MRRIKFYPGVAKQEAQHMHRYQPTLSPAQSVSPTPTSDNHKITSMIYWHFSELTTSGTGYQTRSRICVSCVSCANVLFQSQAWSKIQKKKTIKVQASSTVITVGNDLIRKNKQWNRFSKVVITIAMLERDWLHLCQLKLINVNFLSPKRSCKEHTLCEQS